MLWGSYLVVQQLQNLQYCITDKSLDAIDVSQYMISSQKIAKPA